MYYSLRLLEILKVIITLNSKFSTKKTLNKENSLFKVYL